MFREARARGRHIGIGIFLPDLGKLVEDRLAGDSDDGVTALWKTIWDRYNEGGPDAVEEELQRQLKAVKAAAAKEIRATKEVVPQRKSRGKRRR